MTESSNLRGTIEYFDRQIIKGWALDRASPASRVSLQVHQQGQTLDVIRASVFRWDLRDGRSDGHHGFVFPIPHQALAHRDQPLHICFRETGLELDNSPIQLPVVGESLLAPFQTTDLTGHKVLVLAPHPDDESLACGGALVLHTDHGDPVKVVFLTDGAAAHHDGRYTPSEYVALRKQEALAAASILGVDDLDFWEIPDRQLGSAEGVLVRLIDLLREYRPELIYAPSPLEFHPDHRAAAELVWTAVAESNLTTQVAFFDFNRPVNVNTLIDISSVQDRKRRACELYRSQLENHPYADAAQSLNRYRALTVSSTADHVEGFFLMTEKEIATRPVDSFVVRQFLPQAVASELPRPLVSIIVRTKDRPELLRDALSSIATQTYPNMEVVLVNDGGCDVSAVVNEFSPYLKIKYVRLPRSLGRAAAANRGVQRAKGQFLNFLDDDDVHYPTHIEKLAGYLQATGERMAYSDCERCSYEWHENRFRPMGDRSLFVGTEHDQDRLYWGNYIPFMSAMIRRDLAEEVGSFDESLEVYEDWDYWIRASKHAFFYRLPGITSQYRVFAHHEYSDSALDIYRKHTDYWNVENLARSAWPRVKALGEKVGELEQALAAASQERAKLEDALAGERRRLAEIDQSLQRLQGERGDYQSALEWSREEFGTVTESLLAKRDELENALERSREEFKMVTESYSWRASRLIPQGARTVLKSLLDHLFKGPVESVALQPTHSEAPGSEFTVRSYERGDERQILSLFEQCFGHKRSLEQWRWKYDDNPYGNRKISLAFSPEGELAAHYSAFPVRFFRALEEPRSIVAFQIGDTMTAPPMRHVGRRRTSLLSRSQQHHFDTFCEQRVGFNYGFNTGKIQRYYLRLVPGSRFFESANLMVLEGAPLERLTARASHTLYRVSPVERLDSEWDDFFYRVAKDYGFLVQRDRTYLAWRYLACPKPRYRFYRVSLGGEMVGWGVFHQLDDRLVWGDALFEPRYTAAAGALVAAAVEGCAEAPQRVEGWFGANPRWWGSQLRDLGFDQRPEPQDLGMIYKPFLEPDPMNDFRNHLYYTMGDSDLF